MSRKALCLALALIAGAAALLALRLGRGYPWSLAAIVGVAVGVLVISIWRTGDRLVRLWRGEEP